MHESINLQRSNGDEWASAGWMYGVLRHFQQYFSYIVAISFICEGNRTIQTQKSPTYR